MLATMAGPRIERAKGMTGRGKRIACTTAGAAALSVAALIAAGCGSSSHQAAPTTTGSTTTAVSPTSASELAPVPGTYAPRIDPANFVTTITNSYFPLLPGTAFH
jgi:hypothetical protein